MIIGPLSMARRHVLGDLYNRCEEIVESIPVYLQATDEPQLLGHADQALGHYADAFSFHLDQDHCKRLSAGQYTYSFDYDFADPKITGPSSRVKLNSITLTGRKGYDRPISKSRAAAAAIKPE